MGLAYLGGPPPSTLPRDYPENSFFFANYGLLKFDPRRRNMEQGPIDSQFEAWVKSFLPSTTSCFPWPRKALDIFSSPMVFLFATGVPVFAPPLLITSPSPGLRCVVLPNLFEHSCSPGATSRVLFSPDFKFLALPPPPSKNFGYFWKDFRFLRGLFRVVLT